MKIKDGFMLREIAGVYIVVPLGERVIDFNGLLTLNETGAFIWRQLGNDTDPESLVSQLINEYEIDNETATDHINEFIDSLKDKGIID